MTVDVVIFAILALVFLAFLFLVTMSVFSIDKTHQHKWRRAHVRYEAPKPSFSKEEVAPDLFGRTFITQHCKCGAFSNIIILGDAR